MTRASMRHGILYTIFILLLCITLSACQEKEIPQNPDIPRPDIEVAEIPDGVQSAPAAEEDDGAQKPAPFYNSYNITMEINPTTRKVMAIEKISYKNQTNDEIDKIYLKFNVNAFTRGFTPVPYFEEFRSKVFKYGRNYSDYTINSITINGENVLHTMEGRNIGIKLEKPLSPDGNIDITMQFEVTVAKICHRTGANDDAMWFGNFIPSVAPYIGGEFVLDDYYPAGYPFVSEVSNFDVTITTPKDYSVIGTGLENVTEDQTNKTTKMNVNMVRDFAFAMSNKYTVTRITSEEGIMIKFHHYTDNQQKIDRILELAGKAADYFGKTIGAYPYQEIDIIETELFEQGSVALPCVVFIDSTYIRNESSFDSITQKIGRQWFSNVVGSNQIKEPWIDEGITAYLSNYVSYEQGAVDRRMTRLYDELRPKLLAADNYMLTDDLSVYDDWESYYNANNSRAELMFHALKKKMGGERFDGFLKTYFTDYSFKIANSQSLIDVASDVYGERLDGFFEEWMTKRELPAIR